MATMKIGENEYLAQLDSRNRVSLGFLKNPNKRYRIEEQPGGIIILHPVRVVDELQPLEDPDN